MVGVRPKKYAGQIPKDVPAYGELSSRLQSAAKPASVTAAIAASATAELRQ
jgi:hypothetical protein